MFLTLLISWKMNGLHASEWLYFLRLLAFVFFCHRHHSFPYSLFLTPALVLCCIPVCMNWEILELCCDHALYHFMLHNDRDLHCWLPDRKPLVDFPTHEMAGKHVECPVCQGTPTVRPSVDMTARTTHGLLT